MKYLVFCYLVLAAWATSPAQELVRVSDPHNQYEIGVPQGWRHKLIQKKAVVFYAAPKTNKKTIPEQRFSIEMWYEGKDDFRTTYTKYVEKVSRYEGFIKVEQEGEKEIYNRKYKYFIAKFKAYRSAEIVCHYIFFTNKGGEILSLILMAPADRFEEHKELFGRIAGSLRY
jgi:hypothetical protein